MQVPGWLDTQIVEVTLSATTKKTITVDLDFQLRILNPKTLHTSKIHIKAAVNDLTTTMKIISLATLTALAVHRGVTGFSPTSFSSSTTKFQTQLSSAVAQQQSQPERVAPAAGKKPAWENRPGLTPEEFMESDMNKPDASGMWECPLTRWDSDK